MKHECGNCLYFELVHSDDGIGVCRYDPPKLIVVVPDVVQSMLPETSVHRWCGRHQLDPMRVSDAEVSKE